MTKDSLESHRDTYKTSFMYLPINWLIRELGETRFLRLWPQIKDTFDDKSLEGSRKRALNAVWGVQAVLDAQYPVDERIAMLGKKRRALLQEAVVSPGITIYELAKQSKRDYSRVYKDIQTLASEDHVIIAYEHKEGRKRGRVIPKHSINTKLAALTQ